MLVCHVARFAFPIVNVFAIYSNVYTTEYKPPFDATVVSLLRRSGTNIVGKTNCDEFGMGYVSHCFIGSDIVPNDLT